MVVRAWRTLVEIMRVRRERSRARCQFAAMTERELQDCGMSRSEIAYELHKIAAKIGSEGTRRVASAPLEAVENARQNDAGAA
ncbi:hypothetical protein XI08_25275 [Bradyrhizobium sp. CCBAU 11361]|nr:hypothetical protein [Bradyrhizobium sp. CCBAU 11361]